MATARVIELCEAVAEYLRNVQTSFGKLNVIRQNPAYIELEKTRLTNVFVYPMGLQRRIEDRMHFDRLYQVNMHVRNYLEDGQTEIDDALKLVEELEDAMTVAPPMAEFEFTEFTTEVSVRAPYETQSIFEQNLFHVVVTMIFKAVDE